MGVRKKKLHKIKFSPTPVARRFYKLLKHQCLLSDSPYLHLIMADHLNSPTLCGVATLAIRFHAEYCSCSCVSKVK